jgi:hypothetical protein
MKGQTGNWKRKKKIAQGRDTLVISRQAFASFAILIGVLTTEEDYAEARV